MRKLLVVIIILSMLLASCSPATTGCIPTGQIVEVPASVVKTAILGAINGDPSVKTLTNGQNLAFAWMVGKDRIAVFLFDLKNLLFASNASVIYTSFEGNLMNAKDGNEFISYMQNQGWKLFSLSSLSVSSQIALAEYVAGIKGTFPTFIIYWGEPVYDVDQFFKEIDT